MSAADTASLLTSNNESYADGFKHGGKPGAPAKKVAVVTCMDARFHPEAALGLDIGDAHTIRNAGGRTSEALRSVVISQQLLGTREVVVIHHTKCGMETFENEDLHKVVEKNLGETAATQARTIDFLPFKGLEQSVRDDIKLLADSKLVLPETKYHGYVYDVDSGKLLPVAA